MTKDMKIHFRPLANINLFVFCFANAPMQSGAISSDLSLDYPSDPIWLVARTGELSSMDYMLGCHRNGLIKPQFKGKLDTSPNPDNRELFVELIKTVRRPARSVLRREILSDRLITRVTPAKEGYGEIPTLNGAVLIRGEDARSLPFTPQNGFPLFLNGRQLQEFVRENQAREVLDPSESLTRSLKPCEVIEKGTYRLNLIFSQSDLEFAQYALSTFEERSRAVREASWKKAMSIRIG